MVAHPLLGTLVRRLLWRHGDQLFRVDEEGAYTDVNEDEVLLPTDAKIRLMHPIDCEPRVLGWSELFTDYQFIQPIAQLGRACHRPSDDDLNTLAPLVGLEVSVGQLMGLAHRGWSRTQQQAIVVGLARRHLGVTIAILLEVGFAIAPVDPQQVVVISDATVFPSRWPNVDPMVYSEAIRDFLD